MQNAKDTFYEVLRARLAATVPDRTAVVRGITRPGVVVVENELPGTAKLPDCFLLHWDSVAIDVDGALPCVTQTCTIEYATAGTALQGGMDRGRALTEMDSELLQALTQYPQNALKLDYSGVSAGVAATPMATRLWWGEATFSEAKIVGGRLQRTVTVPVMSFQEAGER